MPALQISLIRRDGGTQPRAAIRRDWVDEYASDMAMGTAFPPVTVFFDGTDYWLADGFHRTEAAEQHGASEISADIRQGSRRDAVLFSVSANASHGQRRTNEDKRRAVMVLLDDPEWGKWSQGEIARRCGVDQSFVSRLKSQMQPADTHVQHEYRPVRGTTFIHPKTGQPTVMNTANIGRRPEAVPPLPERIASPAPLAAIRPPPFDFDPEPDTEEEGDVLTVSLGDPVPDDSGEAEDALGLPPRLEPEVHNHRAQGTGENEWYTPALYVEAARQVLGAIDLDPASSEAANRTVRAERFFDIHDDGLECEWNGRVWMNPPYAQPHIMNFVQKLTAEVGAGNVTSAIALTHNYTDTSWFHLAAKLADAICFTRGRIAFESPDGRKAAPTQGQAFFYFGPEVQRFGEVFRQFGFVAVTHEL